MFFKQGNIVKVACLQYVTQAVVCLFLEDLEASHKISLHDQLLSWVGSMSWIQIQIKIQIQIQEIHQSKYNFLWCVVVVGSRARTWRRLRRHCSSHLGTGSLVANCHPLPFLYFLFNQTWRSPWRSRRLEDRRFFFILGMPKNGGDLTCAKIFLVDLI